MLWQSRRTGTLLCAVLFPVCTTLIDWLFVWWSFLITLTLGSTVLHDAPHKYLHTTDM